MQLFVISQSPHYQVSQSDLAIRPIDSAVIDAQRIIFQEIFYFGRYRDDCMTIQTRDVDKTNLLIEFLKFLDKNLQFTVEIVGKLLYFLDFKIIIDDKKFLTSVYSKPTDSCLYLDGTSCHATKSIDAISTGLAK